ncbi:zinc finger protein 547-like [Hyperolius riggenbachi]|uniref:zinc finger protein 547-like n=1 Tax=Hyperolius riggenbachi TaxID=752182 RepID=UPI0035A2978D
MSESQHYATERILKLTLEIIYLLTGEDYGPLKKELGHHVTPSRYFCGSGKWYRNRSYIMDSSSSSLTLEGNSKKKILEVINKIIELLTGEVPVRCQDVSVYFSMEEWQYLEGHKDLYEEIIIENRPPITSPDGTDCKNVPKSCTEPLYAWDNLQEDDTMPQSYQADDLTDVKLEDEEYCVRSDEPCKKEELPAEISTVGRYRRDNRGEHFVDLPDGDVEDPSSSGSLAENYITSKKQADGLIDKWEDEEAVWVRDDELCEEEKEIPPEVSTGKHFADFPYVEIGEDASTLDSPAENPVSTPKKQKKRTFKRSETCPDCGKCFTRQFQLVQHLRIHRGERPFSCSDCGKCFTLKTTLERHRRTHTGEKPFSCPECGKTFTRKNSLVHHQGSHRQGMPHYCSECGKSFQNKLTLMRHQRKHLQVLPYSCKECGKSFSVKSSFVGHVRKHTGEKPFLCSVCGKAFSLRPYLLFHQSVHMTEKPFSCSECGKGFVYKSRLLLHQKVHADHTHSLNVSSLISKVTI